MPYRTVTLTTNKNKRKNPLYLPRGPLRLTSAPLPVCELWLVALFVRQPPLGSIHAPAEARGRFSAHPRGAGPGAVCGAESRRTGSGAVRGAEPRRAGPEAVPEAELRRVRPGAVRGAEFRPRRAAATSLRRLAGFLANQQVVARRGFTIAIVEVALRGYSIDSITVLEGKVEFETSVFG